MGLNGKADTAVSFKCHRKHSGFHDGRLEPAVQLPQVSEEPAMERTGSAAGLKASRVRVRFDTPG